MINRILRIAETICLVAIGVAAISIARAGHEAQQTIRQIGESVAAVRLVVGGLPAAVDARLASIQSDANRQLNVTRATLDGRLSTLLAQTGAVSASAARTSDTATALLSDARTKTLPAADAVLANPDIPKLIRDARQTVAITGGAMAHVRATADAAAQAAPDVATSIKGISANAAGITADIHTLTSDLVKPKPLWRRILSYVGDGVKLGGAVAAF